MGLVGLACCVIGLVLAARGRAFRLRERMIGSFPQAKAADLASGVGGGPCVVSGVAASPKPVVGPVSGRECAFYEESLEVYRAESHHERGRRSMASSSGWRFVRSLRRGGFFVQDGTGLVFVAPSGADLYSMPHESEGAQGAGFTDGDERRVERRLEPGEPVVVVGSPRPLSALLEAQRRGPGTSIQLELIEWLLEAEREGKRFACFFSGAGPFMVAGCGLDDLKRRLSSGADSGLSVGLALLGIGIVLLVGAYLGIG